MKIVNFNSKNFWRAWNKQYCQDINRSINSLYDFMLWNYPEYVIFNSPTPLSGDIVHNIDLQTNGYQQDLGGKSLFFPSKLNFHQGFYNQSSLGDGYLCFPVTETTIEDDTIISWTLPENSSNKYIVIVNKLNINIIDSNNWTSCGNNTWEPLDIIIPATATLYSAYDFPSGYMCILNKQPNGENVSDNSIKLDVNNYLIAPVGSGGYYNLWWNNNNLMSTYSDNKFGSFINKITINLAQGCRYISYSPLTLSTRDIDVTNYNLNGGAEIADIYENIWTGQGELVGRVVNKTGDIIMCDVAYDVYLSSNNNMQLHHFVADIDEKITLANNVILY